MDPETAEAEVRGRRDLREKLARGLGVEFEAAAEPGRVADDAGSGSADASAATGAGLAVQEALYRVLGRSGAGLVLASLEDLWMETEPQNVPGTPAEDNWRRRTRRRLEEVTEGPAARLLTALNEAREGRA